MEFGHGGYGMPHCGPRHWGPPVRYCRREAKELLVVPDEKADTARPMTQAAADQILEYADKTAASKEGMVINNPVGGVTEVGTTAVSAGRGTAVIGGGCCVELAVEYMPIPGAAAADCRVAVEVVDSEGTVLTWMKDFSEGYHVKENIIVTYPGAMLMVRVRDAIARVRWCEVFSC